MQISDTEMDKEQQKEELQMENQIGWKERKAWPAKGTFKINSQRGVRCVERE